MKRLLLMLSFASLAWSSAARETETSFRSALRHYEQARPNYARSGRGDFIAALPADALSAADLRFLHEKMASGAPLPDAKLEGDTTLVLTLGRGVGLNERLVLKRLHAKPGVFLVNEREFLGRASVAENYRELLKEISRPSRAWGWIDWLVPSAHAGGANGGSLLLPALVGVAAGVITYVILKEAKGSSSSGSGSSGASSPASSSDGPEIGDPTVVHEESAAHSL